MIRQKSRLQDIRHILDVLQADTRQAPASLQVHGEPGDAACAGARVAGRCNGEARVRRRLTGQVRARRCWLG